MKIPKWLWLIVGLSIALNLALIGFVAGKASGGAYHIDPARMFPRWARSLPQERFEELRPMLREHMRQHFPNMRALRSHHQKIRAAMVTQPFQDEALSNALVAWRQAIAQTQAASDQALVEFVGQLTAAEREQFAEQMLRHRPRHPPPPRHQGAQPFERPGAPPREK